MTDKIAQQLIQEWLAAKSVYDKAFAGWSADQNPTDYATYRDAKNKMFQLRNELRILGVADPSKPDG